MISAEQKEKIDKIVSVFETGKLPSNESYSTATILKDGAGISYGKHQSTDKSGTLDKIIFRYIDLNGLYADDLSQYLQYLQNNESIKNDERAKELLKILKAAGQDKVMQQCQDEIFNNDYWKPIEEKALYMDLKTAFSHLALYDTAIHSGPNRIESLRMLFPEVPPSKGGSEKVFIKAFLTARFNWLMNFVSKDINKQKLVRSSSKRVTELIKILENDNLDLNKPISIYGIKI